MIDCPKCVTVCKQPHCVTHCQVNLKSAFSLKKMNKKPFKLIILL